MTRLYDLDEVYITFFPSSVQCPVCKAEYELDVKDQKVILKLPLDGTCEHFAFLMRHEWDVEGKKMFAYEICWILNPEVQAWIEKMYIRLVTERPSSPEH
jgi:hypothetical protein